MKPLERLGVIGGRIQGWLPKRSAAAGPHGVPGPWWWIPAWSMGVWVAEAAILNLVVPVSTLGLPLFLVNMWLSFVVGGFVGHRIGRKWIYRLLPSGPRWKTRTIITLSAGVVELVIGIAYFSVSDWDYVLTHCQTGNACTFFQFAPVFFLILGVIVLVGVAILATSGRLESDG